MDTANCSDELLVRSAREGSREAFDALVRRYQFQAVALTRSILRNFELAEDASQNAFAKAYFALAHFREDSKFKTWFFRILINEAKDVLRREKVRGLFRFVRETDREDDESVSILELIPSHDRSPKEALEAEEAKERLDRAIRQLPSREQEVFILRYLQGLSLAEVAEALGIALGTVKAHLAHGSNKLKSILLSESEEVSK